ncbi:MAG: dicarboxylate/amino acid:cation symporter [Clostridiales bacterium]|nr:dicarboxylate/amino acid:cation symporter [Candidatus Equinaster intestinalis]
MKRKTEIYKSTISPSSIDECSKRVSQFIKELKQPNRDAVRYSLAAEEILLKTLENSAEEKSFVLKTGYKFFKPFISIEIDGESQNLYVSDDEQSFFGKSILKNLGLAPEYAYVGGTNSYNFKLKKKSLNPFIGLVLALALAVVIGFLGLLLPENIRSNILNGLLIPLHDTFLNVLGCIAGPMIFLSVAWGIYGIGDAATLKQVGKKLLGQYVITVFALTVILGLGALPFFTFADSSGAADTSGVSAIFNMILGIFPKNIFSPFIEGNTLQIIFLAIVIGIAMLFLGRKTKAVALAVEQINYIVQFLIEFISNLVPYFIFIAVLKMIWSNMTEILLNVGKLLTVFIGAIIVMLILLIAYTSIKLQCNPFVLLKKGLPTFLIGLTTASSAAAFGTNMKTCTEGYGIDKKMSSFGIPLGMVTFKPATAICYVIICLFFAEYYSIPVSPSWFIVLLFSAGILAVATPPIPGGSLTAYTVMFTQLGIPAEALAIAIAVDALFDFIDTGIDQLTLPFALLTAANRLGLVDKKTLRKK